MQAEATVYIKITGVTARGVTATCSFTKPIPVDYTVVVADSAENKIEGVSVELWNNDSKVGEAVLTDSDGAAVFTGVNPAEYTVKITSDKYALSGTVKTKKSLIPCTTEALVIKLVQYTVTLDLPDGVEATVFDGVTVTLENTEATGTLQNGTVTFEKKVIPNVYTILIEKDGYSITGTTATNNSQATATVKVVENNVNKIVGCDGMGPYGSDESNSNLQIGNNLLTAGDNSHSTQYYAVFTAMFTGNYTFTVNDSNLYLRELVIGGDTFGALMPDKTFVYNGAVGADGVISSETNADEKIISATIALTAGQKVYVRASTEPSEQASITVTQGN